MNGKYQHWKLETDDDKLLWLHLDKAGASANTLSKQVLEELDDILTGVEKTPPDGLLLISDKASGFIAGADVKEFTEVKSRQEAAEIIQRGQRMADRIEDLPCATAALIDGFCLGGGLELALACDYRIATDSLNTKIGLPEVKLGIHPGFGGSVRLIELIGVIDAMPLMLAGRMVGSYQAKKLGIVDALVPKRHLQTAGRDFVTRKPPQHQPGRLKALASGRPVRPLLAGKFRKEVAKKASKEHYPAPYALIDIWEQHADHRRQWLQAEAESVTDLFETDTAHNLVRVFFLQERMKSLGKQKDYRPKRVHVIGAGVMGGDIAAWCALQGFTVTLQDREPKYIAPAIKRAKKLFDAKLRAKHLNTAAGDRLIPDHKGLGIEKADIIIEAIVENAEIKQALYREIEPRMKPDAILATNTSSIKLETLGEALEQPERLVGIHFFNPVAKMQLVEIIHTETTPGELIDRTSTFIANIRKLPLPVKSSPGFLVNRVLMPYLLEAVELLSEGYAPETIDRAATDFGMPMGPILLADTVGLDICLSVANILGQQLGVAVPDKLKQMVDAKKLGRKSGEGFYRYEKGKPVISKEAPAPDAVITDRLVGRLLNESVAVLREGVVEDADLLDAGMIFGTGFAPFRGGPMHYIKSKGKGHFLQKLEELEKQYGERFKPDAGWKEI